MHNKEDMENENAHSGHLNIFDLSGQERFEFVVKDYLRGVNKGGGIVVYEAPESLINPEKTRKKIDYWVEQLKNYNTGIIILVGSKYDKLTPEQKNQIRDSCIGDDYACVRIGTANYENKKEYSILSSIKGGADNYQNHLALKLTSLLQNNILNHNDKVAIVGGPGVGKTTLVSMLMNQGEAKETGMTIGAEYACFRFKVE
jgi:GTPase SAR1 family protein